MNKHTHYLQQDLRDDDEPEDEDNAMDQDGGSDNDSVPETVDNESDETHEFDMPYDDLENRKARRLSALADIKKKRSMRPTSMHSASSASTSALSPNACLLTYEHRTTLMIVLRNAPEGYLPRRKSRPRVHLAFTGRAHRGSRFQTRTAMSCRPRSLRPRHLPLRERVHAVLRG